VPPHGISEHSVPGKRGIDRLTLPVSRFPRCVSGNLKAFAARIPQLDLQVRHGHCEIAGEVTKRL